MGVKSVLNKNSRINDSTVILYRSYLLQLSNEHFVQDVGAHEGYKAAI